MIQTLKTSAVAVSIAINNKLQFYKEGTFSLKQDDGIKIDHAVALMGFNHKDGFLIKNSWGEGWGMNGYAYADD